MKKHSPDIFRTNFFGEKIVVICGPNGHKFLWSNENKYFTTFYPQAIQKLFLTSQPKVEKLVREEAVQAIRGPAFLKPEALVHYLAGMDSIIQQQLKTHLQGKSEREQGRGRDSEGARNRDQGEESRRGGRITESGPVVDVHLHRVMSDAEVADKIMGLLIAGYSTVATTMTFFMKYVGERPEVYHKQEISKAKQPGELLCWDDMQKMKYSWAVICEVMRLVPPLLGTFREAMTDFTYAGYSVPKGWKVFWTVNTTQKNPEYFREPNKFDPSRFMEGDAPPAFTYVPFGGGPRMCPGKEYARLVVLAFIHNVVKKYKWSLVDPREKIVGSMMPLPEKGLPVRLYPR
ncbi:hypothetical protein RHMOL_Rhmol02G0091700 [Rhododendron molle]|uniref:Uncharacterized protein n=1 Tax=Rhododendron molle TaxID=49168 RepID=A0ACC0PPK0_RHOML|nr:hypothetical protein RHMOL_Rhmol02G0091700 [Rhododendron molle]